jgi:hypothetical protein
VEAARWNSRAASTFDRKTEWIVSARRDHTPDTDYDGRGQAATIEQAMAAAIENMRSDDPDSRPLPWRDHGGLY